MRRQQRDKAAPAAATTGSFAWDGLPRVAVADVVIRAGRAGDSVVRPEPELCVTTNAA